MLKEIFYKLIKKSPAKIQVEMGVAVTWKNIARVKKLLALGANSNGRCGIHSYLAKAVLAENYELAKILLDAGADPSEPYDDAGMEVRLSDLASRFAYPEEFISMLKKAEAEAAAIYGERQLKNYRICPVKIKP